MRPLSNERHIRRILKKAREAWDVVEGNLDGRAMVEVRLVHESAGQWITTSTAHPFRCRAETASEIGAALREAGTDGEHRHG